MDEEFPSDGDYEPCSRCGSWRLPVSWYKPGFRWLGHTAPCIGADRTPDHENGSRHD